MIRRITTAVLLIMWIGLPASAEEGFFFKPTLPKQLHSAWDATFLIQYKDGALASAFVIDKQPITKRRVRLLFLTSGHIVQGHCPKAFGSCKSIQSISSSEGVGRNDNAVLMNHRDWTITEAVVVDYDLGNDLALLETVVRAEKYQDLKPIPRYTNCSQLKRDQPVYVIGFPNVSRRTAPDALTIPDKDHVIRRWSRGVIVVGILNNDVSKELQERHHKIGTTADSIFGNSGGPGLTADGEFFGVAHAIRTIKPPSRDAQNPFSGNKKTREWHSNFSGCQAMADFLSR